jgi:hypothetical protein
MEGAASMLHMTTTDFGLHDFLLAGVIGPALLGARFVLARLAARLRSRRS